MKEIIKRVFDDYNFEERTLPLFRNENVLFEVNLNENCINFYLVIFLSKIEENFLEDQVPELYYAIKSLENGYDERMDKNLSMLICLESDKEIEEKDSIKKIFEIEEDPYFFKKYVFTYTQEQAYLLSELFNQSEDSSRIILNNIINDTKLFLEFKNQPHMLNNSIYNLCSKLLIKMPFLVFERGEKKIEDLSEKIREDLQTDNLLKYTEGLLQIKETKDVDNVDDILAMLVEGDEK